VYRATIECLFKDSCGCQLDKFVFCIHADIQTMLFTNVTYAIHSFVVVFGAFKCVTLLSYIPCDVPV